MNNTFRWGIIGGGFISSQFARGLQALPNTEAYAVASRTGKINERLNVEKIYSSYEELAADPKVDAVYIGTLHSQHMECAEICLKAGKPVLCEKPVTMNANECRKLIRLSQEKRVFFMEAMWTRFLPIPKKLKEICQSGKYGKIETIQISFGSPSEPSVERLFKAEFGGGALLDLGVYGVSFANMLLGEKPTAIHAWANTTDQKIDLLTSAQLEYPSGCVADLLFSIDRRLKNQAYILTEKAELCVPFFWRPEYLFQYPPNGAFILPQPSQHYYLPLDGNGYNYEAEEVERCIRNGEIESPGMTHRDSLDVMETMDEIRRQCGICFPND